MQMYVLTRMLNLIKNNNNNLSNSNSNNNLNNAKVVEFRVDILRILIAQRNSVRNKRIVFEYN